MATTTNYSWTTPDDTDLVKNGASAIRTLGSSIDTTTKNLNPSTTLGDIEYRSSSANTNTRLGIGSTGQVLTVAGGVPSWATPSSGGMTLLSTTTLSGSSTTVSGISGSYKNLYILIVGINTASNSVVTLKPNGSANIVDSAFIQCINGIQDSVLSKYSSNLLISGDNISVNAATTTNIFTIDIFDYANASFQKLANYSTGMVRNASQETQVFGNGRIKTTSAITSFEITSGTGNFNGGTIYTYGVN